MLAMARRRLGAELVRWIEADASVLGDRECDLAAMAGNVAPVITDNRDLVAIFAAIRGDVGQLIAAARRMSLAATRLGQPRLLEDA